MRTRTIYSAIGTAVGACVDLLINLLAAAIQQRAFADQFTSQSIFLIVGLITGGLLVGRWLGGPIQVPAAAPLQPTPAAHTETVTITRLRALLSYAELKGTGISLTDILLIGSYLKIDSGD